MERTKQQLTLAERWGEIRPTKTLVAWACVGSIVLTVIVGFTWAGWVRGATALSMAEATAEDAVVKRLAPICAAQAARDPEKEQKLKAMGDLVAYERSEYVQKQGWASMPGEKEPDRRVAEACAMLLAP
jgi:hypothetical protein